MRHLGARLVVACAVLAGCSADRHDGPMPILPGRVPLMARTEAPPASASLPTTEVLIDPISGFTPLLAEPAFSLAREALDAADFAAAARAVELALGKASPAPEGVQRAQYLLAQLREAAGELRPAAASYDLAVKAPGPLAGYAHLGAGRVLARAGLPAEALPHLDAVKHAGPLGAETSLVRAATLAKMGDRDAALTAYRGYLAENASAPEAVRAAVELTELLVAETVPTDAAARVDVAREVITLSRRALARAPGDPLASRADAALKKALGWLPDGERRLREHADPKEELERLRALVESRQFEDAIGVADSILVAVGDKARDGDVGCETELLRARALGGLRRWGAGADEANDLARRCRDADVRARALFVAGKYADVDKRFSLAIHSYEALEHDYPTNSLADDARLRAALTHREMGAAGRFTELLTRMPDDYPSGDMVLDGLFVLGLDRIDKGDWAGSASVLERAASLAHAVDDKRGQEFAGRERYFHARALQVMGETERALSEYEALVRELPLSYYMLHAYGRLADADAARAARVLDESLGSSAKAPFVFDAKAASPLSDAEFAVAVELLRAGDVERGRRELDALGVVRANAAPAVLWSVAVLYGRAGSAKLSNDVARSFLSDYLLRWPAGDWARAWEIAFPRPYHDLVSRETKKDGVAESLVYAVMREESSFDPDAESPAKAYGLMQLIVPTARQFGKAIGLSPDADQLKRPAVNVRIGCRVLSELTRSFPQNPLLAIPGYNAGAGKPRRWLADRSSVDFDVWVELIPYLETRRYTKRVLASRAAYAFLYEHQNADSALRLPIRLSAP